MSWLRSHSIAALAISTIVLVGGSAATSAETAVPAPLAGVPAGRYMLDKAHSTIIFKVSHLGFSFYTASFSRFDATLDLDPTHIENTELTATIDAASLALPAPPDGFLAELLGPKWLNAGPFPEMTYRSTRIEPTSPTTARVTGDFTLNGRTVPVTLDVTFIGGYLGMAGFDPNARIGFSAAGGLNRSDFGVSTGIPPPGSTMGVSDQVSFVIETEFTGPPLAETESPRW